MIVSEFYYQEKSFFGNQLTNKNKYGFFPFSDVFDVVRDAKDRVFLLDFAPFNEKYSEALAFEWNELLDDSLIRTDADDADEEDPEFRYLSSNCGIQPNKRNNYGIPKDVIDMFRPSSSSSDDPSTSQSPNTLDDVINNRLENVRFIAIQTVLRYA